MLLRNVTVLCEEAIPADQRVASGRPVARPAWKAGDVNSVERLAREICDTGARTVVIQHQIGLMPPEALRKLLDDDRLIARKTIVHCTVA